MLPPRRTLHVGQLELRRLEPVLEHVERARDALEAEHVVAVGRDVDLVEHLLAGGRQLVGALLHLLAQHLLLRGLQWIGVDARAH